MSQTFNTMATATTSANLSTQTLVDNAVTTISTIITSTLVKVISHQAEASATATQSSPAATPSATSTPSPFIREPYASAFNFFGSLAGIFYFFVVTFPAAIIGIIAIWTWRRRCQEKAAAKWQQDIERVQTRMFRAQLVQEARLQRECLERMEKKMIASGMEAGVNAALATVVEAMKEGRQVEGTRKRRRKEQKEMREGLDKIENKLDGVLDLIPKAAPADKKNKRKDRPYRALLPNSPAKNNAPAWGSTSTTELESLLDADGLVDLEGKEDDDYEADKEESVYDEDDSRSTVSTASTPEYYRGEWDQAEKQPFLVMEEEWDWKPVRDESKWW